MIEIVGVSTGDCNTKWNGGLMTKCQLKELRGVEVAIFGDISDSCISERTVRVKTLR